MKFFLDLGEFFSASNVVEISPARRPLVNLVCDENCYSAVRLWREVCNRATNDRARVLWREKSDDEHNTRKSNLARSI